MPSRTPRVPSIGLASSSAAQALERVLQLSQLGGVASSRARVICSAQLEAVGQELVQRRVEQADRHRQALHRLEHALEVRLLEREQLVERGAAPGLVVGHDHRAHLRHGGRRP